MVVIKDESVECRENGKARQKGFRVVKVHESEGQEDGKPRDCRHALPLEVTEDDDTFKEQPATVALAPNGPEERNTNENGGQSSRQVSPGISVATSYRGANGGG